MKFAFYTLGCKVNQYETQAMQQMLLADGHTLGEFDELCDGYIINTCTVTAVSDKKSRNAIRRVRRLNPNAVVGVCGCYAQANPDEIRKLDVDVLVGTADRRAFISHLEQAAEHKQKWEKIEDNRLGQDFEILPAGGLAARTRALLKVEDGCNNFCSYCIVPYVRGRERSRDPQCVLQEVRELVAAGYKDITLLGQNVNSYGNDLDLDYHFPDLLEDIDKIPGEYLIRFMSSHPKDATNHLFDVMAKCSHVAKQLHLPFQSGNDRVLKEMNRRYTREKYLEEIRYAKSVMPGLVLTSDVIIGFPGETEAEAMDTVSLVEEVGFDALFTFIYSPRPGTKAASMPDPATRAEKQKWFDRLLEVQNANSARLHAAYVGKTVRVLVDGESDDENFPLASRTEGNRLVRLKGDKSLIGSFIDVKITDSNTWALYGEPV